VPLASPDIQNIIIGAPSQVAISDYVATRGAGTFYNIGYTIGGVMISYKRERFKLSPDQFLGNVISEPIKAEATIKFKMLEGMIENLRLALALPAGAKTGADPNFTLKVNMSERAIYHQVKVTGRGLGTTKVRTFTSWRCVFQDFEDLPLTKEGAQIIGVTIDCLEETAAGDTDFGRFIEA